MRQTDLPFISTSPVAADVDPRIDLGMTPLHAAAMEGNLDALRALVAAGAQVGATTNAGTTAQSIAELAGRPAIAQFLRAARRRRPG